MRGPEKSNTILNRKTAAGGLPRLDVRTYCKASKSSSEIKRIIHTDQIGLSLKMRRSLSIRRSINATFQVNLFKKKRGIKTSVEDEKKVNNIESTFCNPKICGGVCGEGIKNRGFFFNIVRLYI